MPKYPAEPAVLRALLNAIPTAVMVADNDAIYRTVNDAACALLGRTRDQLVGHHLSDLVAPGRMAEVDTQWQAFLRDGAQSGLFTITLPGGAQRTVHFDATAHFLPGLHCSFLAEAPVVTPPAADDSALPVMCAWTKQMLVRGEWVTIEEYLEKELGVIVSHGISPMALEAMREEREARDH